MKGKRGAQSSCCGLVAVTPALALRSFAAEPWCLQGTCILGPSRWILPIFKKKHSTRPRSSNSPVYSRTLSSSSCELVRKKTHVTARGA
eukprot:4290846-Pleurochrysis_carterae.AAC.1